MDEVVRRSASHILRGSLARTPPRRALYYPGLPRTVVRSVSSAPSIAETSFWKSLIPKPFRRRKQEVDWHVPKKPKSKEWNPATFFIVIFLFIGSMSIQMIALRRDFNTFTRRAETRIGVLREVVEKLQKGEEVDVEKALESGDAESEKEWEEVMKEMVKADSVKRKKTMSRRHKKTEPTQPDEPETESAASEAATETSDQKPSKAKPTNYSSFF